MSTKTEARILLIATFVGLGFTLATVYFLAQAIEEDNTTAALACLFMLFLAGRAAAPVLADLPSIWADCRGKG